MSDDWGLYRRGGDGEGEKGEADEGREPESGWSSFDRPADEPTSPDPGPDPEGAGPEEPDSGWPTQASNWESGYRDDPVYPAYGGHRPYRDAPSEVEEERYGSRRSRDPLARLFPGLPHSVRVTLDWILTIVGAILIVLALKQWVVNPYRIPSSSMEPTLNCAKGPTEPGCLGGSSDRVLACRICLDFGPPSRGDIVVFNTPSEAALKCGEGGTFVKRVIGLPGDTVREDDNGFIWIKGAGDKTFVKLKEPYLTADRRLEDSAHFGQIWHVPEGQYFMMGDNRSQSCDSRTWGSVPRNKLIGTVFFVYWPPDRIGFR
jgi:signal peptidase I